MAAINLNEVISKAVSSLREAVASQVDKIKVNENKSISRINEAIQEAHSTLAREIEEGRKHVNTMQEISQSNLREEMANGLHGLQTLLDTSLSSLNGDGLSCVWESEDLLEDFLSPVIIQEPSILLLSGPTIPQEEVLTMAANSPVEDTRPESPLEASQEHEEPKAGNTPTQEEIDAPETIQRPGNDVTVIKWTHDKGVYRDQEGKFQITRIKKGVFSLRVLKGEVWAPVGTGNLTMCKEEARKIVNAD